MSQQHFENNDYSIDRSIIDNGDKLDSVLFHVTDKKEGTSQWFSFKRDESSQSLNSPTPNIQILLKTDGLDDAVSFDIGMTKAFNREMYCVDGLMHIYHEVSHDVSLAPVEQRGAILDFMDKYFFNTTESREILNAYMQRLENPFSARVSSVYAQSKPNPLLNLVHKIKSWKGK